MLRRDPDGTVILPPRGPVGSAINMHRVTLVSLAHRVAKETAARERRPYRQPRFRNASEEEWNAMTPDRTVWRGLRSGRRGQGEPCPRELRQTHD
jgi:hypothetical protein